MTDSHYLAVMLESRILGGYYLGCAMSDRLRLAHGDLQRRSLAVSSSQKNAIQLNEFFLDGSNSQQVHEALGVLKVCDL